MNYKKYVNYHKYSIYVYVCVRLQMSHKSTSVSACIILLHVPTCSEVLRSQYYGVPSTTKH